ncbi:MAG: large conductance mechanosensitive channel protein MscL [Halobacteriales archaeon]|nr:large conductance mechanosensitive channel protein MscL [Halobacteriales archaeon]
MEAPRVRKVKFVEEFQAFVLRGNVLDLAVGIIIGAAFGAVIGSLVNDVIMPPIGLALGGADFQQSYLLLKPGAGAAPPYASLDEAKAAGAVTLRYGLFINTLLTFVIVALAVFLLVRVVGKMKRKEAAALPTEAPCPLCLMAVPLGAKRCGHCASDIAGRV